MCVCVRKIKHTLSPAEVWSRGMEVFSTPAPVDTRRYPKMLKRQGGGKKGGRGCRLQVRKSPARYSKKQT